MAITSLILGITNFILCWIPVVGIITVVPIIIAIVLGIVSLVKMSKNPNIKQSKGPAVAGISLSIAGFVIMIAWLVLIYYAIEYYKNYEDSFTEMLKDKENITEYNYIQQNEEINEYKDIIRNNMK